MDLFISLLIDGVCTGARYAILGMGFALIFNTSRTFDVSFGGIYVWCGFGVWVLISKASVSPLFACPIALALSFGLCYLIQKKYMRKLRGMSGSGASATILLGSIAINLAMEAIASIIWGGDNRLARSGEADVFRWGIIQVSDIKLYTLLISIAIFLFFEFIFMRTSIGIKARSIASNPFFSKILGLDAESTITIITCIGCTIIAIDAIMMSFNTGIYPTIGFQCVFIGFLAVIVGGIGSFRGGALGGFIIGLVRTVAICELPTLWQELILFAILFLIIAFRPTGMFGIKHWKSEV
jgi:branched-chain amino acid transport system permease protein